MSAVRIFRAAYPRQIFCDTSASYALLDCQDRHHSRARQVFESLSQGRRQLVLTNFIRAEAHGLILNRLGHPLAIRFLEQLAQSVATTLVRVTPEDEDRALGIIARYHDKDFSFTDASSFAVMERLGLTHAVAFDDHFRQYGLIVL
jgi:uncharacterized protein